MSVLREREDKVKIAITGASGFIGLNLSRYLHQRGHKVIGLVRSADKVRLVRDLGVEFDVVDVTRRDSLNTVFREIEGVVHLAALFNDAEASSEDFYQVNVDGTQNVLAAAMDCGVRRVVHCSTVGVAASGKPPYSEQTPCLPPDDKYETTKYEGEKVALDFHRECGFPVVVIRPAQVYGPGDTSKAKFYKMVHRGIMVNPGKTMRHMVYIDDLCRAFELAMLNDQAVGEVFIIGDEKAIALRELVDVVAHELGVAPPKVWLPATPMKWLCATTETVCPLLNVKPPLLRRSMDFFTRSLEFDVTKAQTCLGFRSQIDISTGVAKTVAWYKANGFL